jgi:hypothetical protein
LVEPSTSDPNRSRYSGYDSGLMPPQENEPQGVPQDVAAIRQQIRVFLDTPAAYGKKIGKAKWGVYAFYDYDGEPIYVGQTNEMLQVRIPSDADQRSEVMAIAIPN